MSEHLGKLFEPSIVDSLKEGAFFDPFGRGVRPQNLWVKNGVSAPEQPPG
jgi:hypothetical protein